MNEKQETDNVRDRISRGQMLFKMGKYNEAEIYYKNLLKSLSESDFNIQQCYMGLGAISVAQEDYDVAYQYYTKAVELELKHLPIPDRLQLAYCYAQIGVSLKAKHEFKQSLENFNRALDLYVQTRGYDHVDTARVYTNIGLLYRKQKNNDLALTNLNKALQIQLKIFPENHSEMGVVVAEIGLIYHEKKEYDSALIYYKKSLAIQLKNFPNHCDTAEIYIDTGSVYAVAWQNYSEALINYEKALEIYRKNALPTAHPNIISVQNRILAAKLLSSGAITMDSHLVCQGDPMKIVGAF